MNIKIAKYQIRCKIGAEHRYKSNQKLANEDNVTLLSIQTYRET